MNSLVVLLWIISMIPLFLIPYSIARFYQRSFGRNTYPYFFLISYILLAASSLRYVYPSFDGMMFFALGGLLLGGTSLRLDQVMTRRER